VAAVTAVPADDDDDDDDDDDEEEEDDDDGELDGAPTPSPFAQQATQLAHRLARADWTHRLSCIHCAHCACRAVDVDKHPIGIILKSLSPIEGVRFELSRDHWSGVPSTFAKLPERVIGKVKSWGGGGRMGNKVCIEWETDGTNSTEHLVVLLRPRLGLKLLPYFNGSTAPKAKGAAAQRDYKVAMSTGPYAPASGAGAGAGETIEVSTSPARPSRTHPRNAPPPLPHTPRTHPAHTPHTPRCPPAPSGGQVFSTALRHTPSHLARPDAHPELTCCVPRVPPAVLLSDALPFGHSFLGGVLFATNNGWSSGAVP